MFQRRSLIIGFSALFIGCSNLSFAESPGIDIQSAADEEFLVALAGTSLADAKAFLVIGNTSEGRFLGEFWAAQGWRAPDSTTAIPHTLVERFIAQPDHVLYLSGKAIQQYEIDLFFAPQQHYDVFRISHEADGQRTGLEAVRLTHGDNF